LTVSNVFQPQPGKTEGQGEVVRKGVLVEDETVVGGQDQHGAPVVAPKTTEGSADESVQPTDRREERLGNPDE
jgi:hypothetical protein